MRKDLQQEARVAYLLWVLLECILKLVIYVHHHHGGELPRKRWAMTLKYEECSVRHQSRGENH